MSNRPLFARPNCCRFRAIVLLVRVGDAPGCMPGLIAKNAASLERCTPLVLQPLHYKVEMIKRRRRNWTAAVLTRVVERRLTAMAAFGFAGFWVA